MASSSFSVVKATDILWKPSYTEANVHIINGHLPGVFHPALEAAKLVRRFGIARVLGGFQLFDRLEVLGAAWLQFALRLVQEFHGIFDRVFGGCQGCRNGLRGAFSVPSSAGGLLLPPANMAKVETDGGITSLYDSLSTPALC